MSVLALVALVSQQAAQIRRVVDLNVAELSSRKNCDVWNAEKWLTLLEERQVLVMTAQIFHDLLEHGYWSMQRTSLIVFDECHHALGAEHPYRKIVRNHYRTCPDGISP